MLGVDIAAGLKDSRLTAAAAAAVGAELVRVKLSNLSSMENTDGGRPFWAMAAATFFVDSDSAAVGFLSGSPG